MARRFLCDSAGGITAEIEADSPVLAAALEHEKAESVVRCAVLMALSALAEGGAWPATVLQAMAVFMGRMKSEIGGLNLLEGDGPARSRHPAAGKRSARVGATRWVALNRRVAPTVR
jgi:hypothetical protein